MFSALYPSKSLEDEMVRSIMCDSGCSEPFVVRSPLAPLPPIEAGWHDIPVVCTVFFMDPPLPRDSADRELNLARIRLQCELHTLIDKLRTPGKRARFADIPMICRLNFVLAARAYAKTLGQYPYKKEGNMRTKQLKMMDRIPYQYAIAWPSNPEAMQEFELSKRLFYTLFERPLTVHMLRLLAGDVRQELTVEDIMAMPVNEQIDNSADE